MKLTNNKKQNTKNSPKQQANGKFMFGWTEIRRRKKEEIVYNWTNDSGDELFHLFFRCVSVQNVRTSYFERLHCKLNKIH